jgi:hypothetical protein
VVGACNEYAHSTPAPKHRNDCIARKCLIGQTFGRTGKCGHCWFAVLGATLENAFTQVKMTVGIALSWPMAYDISGELVGLVLFYG